MIFVLFVWILNPYNGAGLHNTHNWLKYVFSLKDISFLKDNLADP